MAFHVFARCAQGASCQWETSAAARAMLFPALPVFFPRKNGESRDGETD